MSNEQLVEKLEAWVQTHPDSADTPFMNVSTGEEYSVRGLLNSLRASLAGGVQVSANMQTELSRVETWIGGQ